MMNLNLSLELEHALSKAQPVPIEEFADQLHGA
jgi:hypothetical protein